MKDVSRRVTHQAENFLTLREDLPFHDDGSLSDSAFQSDYSNGSSVADLEKSPSSGGAISYERNSLQKWPDHLSFPFNDFSSTSCQTDLLEKPSTSYSDTRECDKECDSKDSVSQPSRQHDENILQEGDKYWENVSSLCPVGPDFGCRNPFDEDAHTQQCKFPGRAQQSVEVNRELQEARHLDWNFTHEALSPITEGQRLEDFECYDSDIENEDMESEVSEALWSPSSEEEDAPIVRPDFVPKLDLSWVFEDEKKKHKRTKKRLDAQRHVEKQSEINNNLLSKSLDTSTITVARKVAEKCSMKDKADCLVSECCKELSHRIWNHKTSLDDCRNLAPCDQRNCSADQTIAHEPRQGHGPYKVLNPVVNACDHANAQIMGSPEALERTVWLLEASDDEELFGQQSEQAESYDVLPETIQSVCDTNHQVCSDQVLSSNNRRKVDCKVDVDSYSPVLLLTKYYVVDEKDSQLSETQQHFCVSQNEQETATRAIPSHTNHETNSSDSGTRRMTYEPRKPDLYFVSSGISDTEKDADTKSKLKLVQFIERNVQIKNTEREEESQVREETDHQHMMRSESNGLYDVEAAVFRRDRKQKLAKFVCFSFGCQSSCCQETRFQPCYCDWKWDMKCFP